MSSETQPAIKIPRSKNYGRNRAASNDSSAYACVVCGKDLTDPQHALWVHEGGSHAVTQAEGERLNREGHEGADLGAHPIGDDCLRAHPELKPYVTPWDGEDDAPGFSDVPLPSGGYAPQDSEIAKNEAMDAVTEASPIASILFDRDEVSWSVEIQRNGAAIYLVTFAPAAEPGQIGESISWNVTPTEQGKPWKVERA
jgi:hypothetical protein